MTKLRIGGLAAYVGDSDSDLDQPKLLLNCNDGIATNMSPGGHVSKRRVRSKPNSSELLEDVADSPFIAHVSVLIYTVLYWSASCLMVIANAQNREAANGGGSRLPLS